MKRIKHSFVLCLLIIFMFLNGCNINIYNNFNNVEMGDINKFESELVMSDNNLQDFDLSFLKLENNKRNIIYSPISIKYALAMLSDGTVGDSKAQIDALIGNYQPKKYNNNSNMSFGNSMFIREDFKEKVKSSYTEKLKDKYDAEIIFDSFTNPDNINKWIDNKTMHLIPKLIDKIDNSTIFFLINALAIDMEWTKQIQSENNTWHFPINHMKEKGSDYELSLLIYPLDMVGYGKMPFENLQYKVDTLKICAAAHKYDIISNLGEENIRNIVLQEYNEFLQNGACSLDSDFDIDKYMDELKANYGQFNYSTDFLFNENEEVKMFAKDLKTYNGTTLQYVGILPKNTDLQSFIKDVDSEKIKKYINALKDLSYQNFEEGYLTIISGEIPVFSFEYELDFKNDLQLLGVIDVFDYNKADLSNIADFPSFIGDAKHKATIEFTNDGIKASAVTTFEGLGAAGACFFDYLFEVPVKHIDLTFDKPFMYLIRDKESGEVWFTGAVYDPTGKEEYSNSTNQNDMFNAVCQNFPVVYLDFLNAIRNNNFDIPHISKSQYDYFTEKYTGEVYYTYVNRRILIDKTSYTQYDLPNGMTVSDFYVRCENDGTKVSDNSYLNNEVTIHVIMHSDRDNPYYWYVEKWEAANAYDLSNHEMIDITPRSRG